MWKCKCKCGNKVIVLSKHLRSGDTKSCGCLHSKGEFQIENLLKEHNINFKREYFFKDLRLEELNEL